MTSTTQTAPARATMIDAAERLVAEHGLSALTLRQVQIAAGQSNKSAAHYHFGSRDGLITAILEDRTAPVERRRRELLERTPDPTPRQLVEALVVPLAERILGTWHNTHGPHTHQSSAYGRFLAQSMLDPELAGLIRSHLDQGFFEVQQRLRATSPLPADVAAWRVDSLAGYVIGALAASEARVSADPPTSDVPSTNSPLTAETITTSLVDACHSILTGPQSDPSARSQKQ